MSTLLSFLSDATCGEACWSAREDVCHCSCGGKNHGCLRSSDGTRPTRSAKIDGVRYELKAVGERVEREASKINSDAGITFLFAHSSRDRCYRDIPAKVRTASASQIAKWPELAAWRGKDRYFNSVQLLWVKS